MALTATQKNKILQLLGYPGKSLDSGSVVYDKVLSDRLINLSTATEELVAALLTKITDLEVKMDKAVCRMSTKKVGDIELNSDNEMVLLRKERRAISREISVLLDIPLRYTRGSISLVV